MNKKFLVFGVLGLLAVTLVSAGVMDHYGMFSTTLDVKQPMDINAEEWDAS